MRQTVRPDKRECTGCGACASICPKGAIAMTEDEEGFLYPKVDEALCVGCDLCEKRCPVGKAHGEKKGKAFGMQHKDAQLRRESSSGGVFTALARRTIASGGVVFGAAFDENLRVEHIGAFDETELCAMRGSKYVQSASADAIANAAALLERGIPVLFSGTPCQVDGLLARVGKKNRENLLTVDFVCHGVPSPGVFASYIGELERLNGKRVTGYTFRDKRLGWKNFSAVATFEDGTEHTGTQMEEPYLRGFLQNLYLRPSCHQCALQGPRHPADITLADLWGAQSICPDRDDDSGLSLVQANTAAGRAALEACREQLNSFALDSLEPMYRANPSLLHPANAHKKRAKFFAIYKRQGFEAQAVEKLLAPPSKAERIFRRIAHLPFGAMRRLRALMGK